MEQFLFKRGSAGLIPQTNEAREWFDKKRLGSDILVEPKELRNPGLFKKYFSLLDLAYDAWSERVEPMEYKGQPVLPNFKKFRNDVVILAGFYTSAVNIMGEVRLDAESLKWSKMSEERFEQLYSRTIDVLLRMVYNGKLAQKRTAQELRDLVEQISGF